MSSLPTVQDLINGAGEDSFRNVHFVVDNLVHASIVSMPVQFNVVVEIADEHWHQVPVTYEKGPVLLVYLTPLVLPMKVDLSATHYVYGLLNGLAFEGEFRPADWGNPSMVTCTSSDLTMSGDLYPQHVLGKQLLNAITREPWNEDRALSVMGIVRTGLPHGLLIVRAD